MIPTPIPESESESFVVSFGGVGIGIVVTGIGFGIVVSELHTDVEEGCVEVPSELHTDLQQFNMSVGDRMDRFIQLFWEEQEKTFKLENRGMRWHPTIINFAIFIRQQSPCVYHCMRDMGILKLPIEYDWLNHVRCFFSGECK